VKPGLSRPEPDSKVVADLSMPLVLAKATAFDDRIAGIGQKGAQLVGAQDRQIRILAAEHGHERDACGRSAAYLSSRPVIGKYRKVESSARAKARYAICSRKSPCRQLPRSRLSSLY